MPRRVSASSTRQQGGTMLGLVIGIVVGVALAMAVALFVTKATIPFVSKPSRPAPAVEAEGAKLPDPNKALYAKDTPPAPAAATPPPDNGTVIASIPPNVAPGADGTKPPTVDRAPADTGITTLQAGAFSNAEDAESMRGRLALLGFESRVQPADRDGAKIYRVRLGPYSRIDDLNRTRQRLIENGVEATLVAPGR